MNALAQKVSFDFHKCTASLMSILLLTINMVPSVSAQPSLVKEPPIPPAIQAILDKTKASKPTSNEHVIVKKGPTTLTKIVPKLAFGSEPTDLDLMTARVFAEPLAPLQTAIVPGENAALGEALVAFKKQKDPSVVSDLTEFLKKYPNSRWNAAVQLNVGIRRFECGYLTDALENWTASWNAAKNEKGREQKSIADRAVAELCVLNARLGRMDELEKLFAEIKDRPLQGSVEQRIHGAKQGLGEMKHDPGCSFMCGPYAVNSLLYINKPAGRHPLVKAFKSTKEGTNLRQIKELSEKLGLHLQAARRSPGSPLVVPSVMHYSLNHFCAITSVNKGKYQLKDPTFDVNANIWVSPDMVDSQSDGYFLIPAGELPKGWSPVSDVEASNVWGKGTADEQAPGLVPCCPATKAGVPGGACDSGLGGHSFCVVGFAYGKISLPGWGMPQASASTMNASLILGDTPMSYSPPIGPEIDATFTYKYLLPDQPATFSFPNLGQDWTYDWVSYLTTDASKNATVRVRGGGSELYPFTLPDNVTNPYAVNPMSHAQLQITDVGTYKRILPDGSTEIFDQPDGTGRVFMTQVVDAQGNAAKIQYDANFRITSITDAIGQASSVTYVSNTVGNVGFYKIARVTDPFGRFVPISYDSTTTYLTSLTDVVQNTTTFVTDVASSLITSMTTPYGTTSFYQYTMEDPGLDQGQGIRFVFPDKSTSVLENYWGNLKTSYYWDREATALYPNDPAKRDYTHCHAYRFLVEADTSLESPIIWTDKPALEGVITYQYEGAGGEFAGPSNAPTSISRTLDDGSTQLFQYQYNKLGHVTNSIDPIGRTLTLKYAANNIDLLEVRETKGSDNYLLGKWEYNNSQHVPNKYIDGSGQSTQLSYNSFGELTQRTDALSNVWARTYDTNGYLTQTDGPLSGNKDVTTFGYDSFGRMNSTTDSEGYVLTTTFDPLNRVTSTNYPDGTSEVSVWNKLDAILSKDRIGRWTQTSFDNMDQREYVIDPLGRKTSYAWCDCGSLSSLTDPAGNVTHWHHDLQGRVVQKQYQDATTINYVYENSTSRLKSKTDALNQTTSYSYASDNRLLQKSYTNAVNPTSAVTYTYDPNYPRMTSVQNGWGTISYSYNPYITDPYASAITGGGMLSTVSNNVIPNSQITYLYDALGRTTNRSIDGANNSIDWGYDAMSRITSEANSLGTFNYNYVDDSPGFSKGTTRLSSISYPNSQSTHFSWYDNFGDQRLQQITNLRSDGTALSHFSYGYDSAGQITQWQQQQGSLNQNGLYGYDPAGQLTSVQTGNTNPAPPFNSESYYAYDVASNRLANQTAVQSRANVTGTITAGDVLTVAVTDAGLSAPESVSYTVQAGDTLSTVAANLAASITADTALQSIGVNAISNGSQVVSRSVSSNVTTFAYSASTGASANIAQNVDANSTQLLMVSGAITAGDVLTITVNDPALPSGNKAISYTVLAGDTLTSIALGLASAINSDSDLGALGVSASSSGQNVWIISASANTTTYDQTASVGATETVVFKLSPNAPEGAAVSGTATAGDVLTLNIFDSALSGGSKTISYTVSSGDTPSTIAVHLNALVNGDSGLQAAHISSMVVGNWLKLISFSGTKTSYRSSVNSGATESFLIGINTNGTQTLAISGSATAGDTINLTVYDSSLSGGSESVSYVVMSGDTSGAIANNLASLINANTNLSSANISAIPVSTVVNINSQSASKTTYTTSVSGVGTEIAFLAPSIGVQSAAYNQVNELTSLSSGGNALFKGKANKPLQSASINGTSKRLPFSEELRDNATLNNGGNSISVQVKDGSGNTQNSSYSLPVNTVANSTLTYDLNGNLASDGINSYSWDAENKLVKITYAGAGNETTFVYDALNRYVLTMELTASVTTSTKQFVWAKDKQSKFRPCEERDGSGAVTKQFFGLGEVIAGTNYYFGLDHLNTVIELTDSSGTSCAEYGYDAFGRKQKQTGNIVADYGYAGYYIHTRSGLCLTPTRQYAANLGRWINRDSIGEAGGINLYSYINNQLPRFSDPSGQVAAEAVGVATVVGTSALAGAEAGAALGPGGVIAGVLIGVGIGIGISNAASRRGGQAHQQDFRPCSTGSPACCEYNYNICEALCKRKYKCVPGKMGQAFIKKCISRCADMYDICEADGCTAGEWRQALAGPEETVTDDPTKPY